MDKTPILVGLGRQIGKMPENMQKYNTLSHSDFGQAAVDVLTLLM